MRQLDQSQALLISLQNDVITDVVILSKNATRYIEERDVLKEPLAEAGARLTAQMRGLSVRFSDLRLALHDFQSSLVTLQDDVTLVWENMLTENFTASFYAQLHDDARVFLLSNNSTHIASLTSIFARMLRVGTDELLIANNRNDVIRKLNGDFATIDVDAHLSQLRETFEAMMSSTDVTTTMADTDEQVLAALQTFIESMQEFLNENEIDTDFYRLVTSPRLECSLHPPYFYCNYICRCIYSISLSYVSLANKFIIFSFTTKKWSHVSFL